MEDSILINTKKILGVAKEYSAFDMDILMHINSAFSTLNQIGIGPAEGYFIESEVETWNDFIGSDARFNSVKSYVYLKTKLLFDPPTTSFLLEAMEKQILEFEWRLRTLSEIVAEETV